MGETPPIQVLSVGTPQFAHQREPRKNQAKRKQVKKNKNPTHYKCSQVLVTGHTH